jgi:hypothetical protein
MDQQQQILEIYFQEYDKLKSEQSQRIGFRDNLIYVTLGLFGGIITSIALFKPANYYPLLVIPWVCLILGWTYVVNDEKISAIGRYIRLTLTEKIKEQTGHTDIESIFGWETDHRSDKRRKRRKIQQLIIDEITFVFSGIIAVICFWALVSNVPLAINIFALIEILLLVILGVEIIIYADLKKGR